MTDNNAPWTCVCGCTRFITLKQFNATNCELETSPDEAPLMIRCANCQVIYKQTEDWTWEIANAAVELGIADVHGRLARYKAALSDIARYPLPTYTFKTTPDGQVVAGQGGDDYVPLANVQYLREVARTALLPPKDDDEGEDDAEPADHDPKRP